MPSALLAGGALVAALAVPARAEGALAIQETRLHTPA